MKIVVHAKPGARTEKIEKVDDTTFVISVKALPVRGKANDAIIAALAVFFSVSKSRIKIIHGFSARRKVIEIK